MGEKNIIFDDETLLQIPKDKWKRKAAIIEYVICPIIEILEKVENGNHSFRFIIEKY